MKNAEKRKISNYLINSNASFITVRELQKTYERYKTEIQTNIDNSDSYEDMYRYLKESHFYFQEIKYGYYSPMQLELFPIKGNKEKKRNIFQM